MTFLVRVCKKILINSDDIYTLGKNYDVLKPIDKNNVKYLKKSI